MINEAGLALIKEFEGLRLEAYPDMGGVYTIGYGATRGVGAGDVWTEDQANQRLLQDCALAEISVLKHSQVALNPNQLSALISFVFNLGERSLIASTLLIYLNERKFDQAADQFLPWIKVRGVPQPGLLRRRQAERELFLTSTVPLSQSSRSSSPRPA